MTKKILLLGRTTIALDDTQQQLERADIQLFAGTSIEDIQAVFAQANVDHVIMGGIALETRLEMVRVIFQASDTTTVHMKDHASGLQGFLPFVRSVLCGLINDEG